MRLTMRRLKHGGGRSKGAASYSESSDRLEPMLSPAISEGSEMDAPPREIPRTVHLIGVGGDGMAALAHCLLGIGCSVSGSDLRSSETTKQLEALGLKLFIGHTPSNLPGAKLVVVSDAIPSSNIELAEARVRAIPVIRRAECLDLLCRSRQS